jgi:hypothetical protein
LDTTEPALDFADVSNDADGMERIARWLFCSRAIGDREDLPVPFERFLYGSERSGTSDSERDGSAWECNSSSENQERQLTSFRHSCYMRTRRGSR